MVTEAAAPALTPEALNLLDLFDKHVNRRVFDFSNTQCLSYQTLDSIFPRGIMMDLSNMVGVNGGVLYQIADAFEHVPAERWRDYDYCRGIAARILAGESLGDIEKTEKHQQDEPSDV